MTTNVSSLEQVMMQDKALRDGIGALVDKERRLAELELLLKLSESGAPLTVMHKSSSNEKENEEKAINVEFSDRIYHDSEPIRVEAAMAAPLSEIETHMVRPQSGRLELTVGEISMLMPNGPKYGLDLSYMGLNDDSVGELTALFMGLSGATSSLKMLDLRGNHLGKAGAAFLIDVVKKFPRLQSIELEGNDFGGKAGISALLEILCRAPIITHLGVSVDEAPSLPFSLDNTIIPPGLPKTRAPLKKGAKSPTKARGRSPTKDSSGAKGKIKRSLSATGLPPLQQLGQNLKQYSSITSLSLSGSAIPRGSLSKLISLWSPPAPTALSTGKKKPASGSATPRRAASASASSSKRSSSSEGKKKSGKFKALRHLSLSKCHIGALSLQDVAVAMGPLHVTMDGAAPPVGVAYLGRNHYLGRVGAVSANVTASEFSGAGATSGGKENVKDTAKEGVSSGGLVLAVPPLVGAGQSVHGCLYFLRSLDLSGCGITSAGLPPLLEALAHHTLFLTHLDLSDNHIDDFGAGQLAEALLLNSARVRGVQEDVAAAALVASPVFQLTGSSEGYDQLLQTLAARASVRPFKTSTSAIGSEVDELGLALASSVESSADARQAIGTRDTYESGGDTAPPNPQLSKHLSAVAAAAGISMAEVSPLRVLDIRNNPLSVSFDPRQHPGCLALLNSLATLPKLISICGSLPSADSHANYSTVTAPHILQRPSLPLSDVTLTSNALAHQNISNATNIANSTTTNANSNANASATSTTSRQLDVPEGRLRHLVTSYASSANPIDLEAIEAAARAVLLGGQGVNGRTSLAKRLDMPAMFATVCAEISLLKVSEIYSRTLSANSSSNDTAPTSLTKQLHETFQSGLQMASERRSSGGGEQVLALLNSLSLYTSPLQARRMVSFGVALWRLAAPQSTTAFLAPLTKLPYSFAASPFRLLPRLHSGPLDDTRPHVLSSVVSVAALGARALAVALPNGLRGLGAPRAVAVPDPNSSFANVTSSMTMGRTGTLAPRIAATWALRDPIVHLEWRSAVVGPASLIGVSAAISINFHVVLCSGGAKAVPQRHIHSLRFIDGSRDRVHARTRTAARIARIEELESNGLSYAEAFDIVLRENPIVAGPTGHSGTQSSQKSSVIINPVVNSNGLLSPENMWIQGANLHVPRPLGECTGGSSAISLPPALAVQGAQAHGTKLIGWPVAWHSIPIPASIMRSIADSSIQIFVEVSQVSAQNLNINGNQEALGAHLFAVHILDAEIVSESDGTDDPEDISNADDTINFSF